MTPENSDIPSNRVDEITGKRRHRPPVNQAQNELHDAEIQQEREQIVKKLKERDEKLR